MDVERDKANHGVRVRISSFKSKKNNFYWREQIELEFIVKKLDENINKITFGFGINGSNGARICTYESNDTFEFKNRDEISFKVILKEPHFVPSKYTIALGVRSNTDTLDYLHNFVDFNVMESNEQGIHYGFTLGPENSGYIDVGAEVIIS